MGKNIHTPIFLSGPHGGGKSTLISGLKERTDLFLKNDFDIDFTIDFPSISSLSNFERCLMRLYHRFFIASHAYQLAAKNPNKIVITDRTLYDSEAYIHTYRKLDWISEDQFQKLKFVMENFVPRPYAVVLNPPLPIIKSRLAKRRSEATRTNRDKIFKDEDSDAFLEGLRGYFENFKGQDKIFYVESDGPELLQKIVDWAEQI